MARFREWEIENNKERQRIAAAQRTDIHVLSDGERFRYCTGYEFSYMVSNWGRVYACARPVGIAQNRKALFLRPALSPTGYLTVKLACANKTKSFTVHSLVADAFLGERPTGNHINHKDGNKKNNSLSNLEYCTPKQNAQHYQMLKRIRERTVS